MSNDKTVKSDLTKAVHEKGYDSAEFLAHVAVFRRQNVDELKVDIETAILVYARRKLQAIHRKLELRNQTAAATALNEDINELNKKITEVCP